MLFSEQNFFMYSFMRFSAWFCSLRLSVGLFQLNCTVDSNGMSETEARG